MEEAAAFLSPAELKSGLRCVICSKDINKGQKSQIIGERGLDNFVSLALEWAKIDIPLNDERHVFSEVHKVVASDRNERKEICAHTNCRVQFRNYHARYLEKYGSKGDDSAGPNVSNLSEINTSPNKRTTRSQTDFSTVKIICFICNSKRLVDNNPYNEGGLTRCSTDVTAHKLIQRKDVYMKDKSHKLFPAARRLHLLLSGQSHDIFAVDIFYHQSCYVRFALKPVSQEEEENTIKETEKYVLNTFLYNLKTAIIRDKKAFLLHELFTDLELLSEEQQLDKPVVKETKSLRRILEHELGDNIGFFPSGKYRIVHSTDINPCEYSVATLLGCGLRDEDHIRAFGRMLRRKFAAVKEKRSQFPASPEDFMEMLDQGPHPDLYNAIYYSMHEHGSKNEYGYAVTSRAKAKKLWSLASDWESLITSTTTPKQAIMGLVIHRLTGNKEVVNYLHKCNHVMSYNNIRLQNQAWSRMVSTSRSSIAPFRRGVITHSTIDNNDGRQDTWTGTGTTHDTNMTVFQVPTKMQQQLIPIIGTTERPLDIIDEYDQQEKVTFYHPGKRVGPPLFASYDDCTKRDLLDLSLKKDIAWSLAGSLKFDEDDIELPLLGSWTAFNKMVTSQETTACVQDYLPVKPRPPDYPVCKEYLDFLLDMLEDLDISHIYVHSDEAVYSKLCDILWENPEIYKGIVLLMGGFHQLRVMQKLLYKRFSCKGFKQWFIDAEVIAAGSVDAALEGRHYFRSMRLHKECFDALVQFRIENITEGHTKTDAKLMSALINLRRKPTCDTLDDLLALPQFDDLQQRVLYYNESSDSELTVCYLKNVSLMLALVSAVRESDINRHMEAEREMIPLLFAFDHQNYARYCSYQHVLLQDYKTRKSDVYENLKSSGYGGSISGKRFSTIHGDLITELFNKETKGTAGPFRSGFSTNPETVNTWVKTIHIHSMLRVALRNQLEIKTSATHKEMTASGRKLHANHVSKLLRTLKGYGANPFSDDKPKSIPTGAEIDPVTAKDMVNASNVGNAAFLSFVSARLIKGTTKFFEPIPRIKLKTGLVKKKPTPKAVSVLKEDCQAFGLIVAKAVSLEEAFCYPITSFPLAIATPEGNLRQSDKSSLRNFLISKAPTSPSNLPKKASWFIDGLAVIRTLKAKKTYREWIKGLLKFLQPPEELQPALVGMINDTYKERSVKEGTRRSRGESGVKVILEGYDQHMPQGLKWNEFLHNGANKQSLIQLTAKYVLSEEGRKQLKQTFVITDGSDTYRADGKEAVLVHNCNHEEADSRLVLHAFLASTDVVIVSKDTDVLILLIWAFEGLPVKTNKWYFKYDSEKFVDVGDICAALGPQMCRCLPALHALSGCDTTSYFFKSGKVKIVKKLLSDSSKCGLLQNLGKDPNITNESIESVKELIRTVFYNGKENESYLQTRIRLYKNMKAKTSSSLPPDPDSIEEAIKRANFQAYCWLQSCQLTVHVPAFEENGWLWNEEESVLKPLWFKGKQLPPSLHRKRKKLQKEITYEEALSNDEMSESERRPRNKKTRNRRKDIKCKNVSSDPDQERMQIDAAENVADATEVYEAEMEDNGEKEFSDCSTPSDHESSWEVSDFSSSEESFDEWLP